MKVKTASPVRELSGTFEGCDVVYSTVNGRIIARGRTDVANPATSEQQLIRTFMANATQNWDALTEAQRAAWQAYAEQYFTTNDAGEPVVPSGIATYARANVIRQVLGLPLTSAAPLEGPPGSISSAEAVPALNPDTLGLTIIHSLPSVVGLQLLVRMTPAMATVARRPTKSDYRYVRGVGSASASVVPASGNSVQFSPTRFLIEDGQRFGVEVRVVRTADGILSRPTTGDFIKVV